MTPGEPITIGQLLTSLPRTGQVTWLGLRPARRAPVVVVDAVEAIAGVGLVGDHFAGPTGKPVATPVAIRPAGKRQVTLLQFEHLAVVGGLLGEAAIDPARLRRNIVVRGINLLALKDRRFRIGAALFEGTGPAPPCSRMETELGPGGYNALRGHGGITARVITSGCIRLGDAVVFVERAQPAATRPTGYRPIEPSALPTSSHSIQTMTDLTAFYDGGCPLCSKEIAHYRRVDRAGRIAFIDIGTAGPQLAAIGLDPTTAMRRLHVQERDGALVRGVPAFIAIWQRLPGYRLLARVVLALRLTRPLDWAYARFADWRFRRRCADGVCDVD